MNQDIRIRRVQIQITEEEYCALDEARGRESMSSYARNVLLGDIPFPRLQNTTTKSLGFSPSYQEVTLVRD